MDPVSDCDAIVVNSSYVPSRHIPAVATSNGTAPPKRKSGKGTSKGFRYQKDNLAVLYLLRTEYRSTWQHAENVFNAVFRTQIQERGLDRGPKGSALATRFNKRLHEEKALWLSFRKKNLIDQKTSAMLRLRIEHVVQAITNVPRPGRTPRSKVSQITREEAHPPTPAVLFRAYCDKTQGLNTPRGFLAAYFQDNKELPLPPLYSDPAMFGVTKRHLNRDEFRSPFVSTCSSLLRTIRRSLKDSERADLGSCRISIIDGLLASEGDRVFHTPPYQRQVANAKAFTNGKWMYRGIDEYLVWAGVPEEAIIKDFALGELLNFCSSDPVLRTVEVGDVLHAA